VITTRGAVEVRVMVTGRLGPLHAGGRDVLVVGLPYHWNANELLPLALDLNVHIAEYKAATCDIRPGRRPHGRELERLVERYQRDAEHEGVHQRG
jgi:formate dehydrogenase major subunit